MREQWDNSNAVCPFYQAQCDKDRRICCEGYTEECRLMTKFRNRRAYHRQLKIFCEDNYKSCELYRMIMAAKYDEE